MFLSETTITTLPDVRMLIMPCFLTCLFIWNKSQKHCCHSIWSPYPEDAVKACKPAILIQTTTWNRGGVLEGISCPSASSTRPQINRQVTRLPVSCLMWHNEGSDVATAFPSRDFLMTDRVRDFWATTSSDRNPAFAGSSVEHGTTLAVSFRLPEWTNGPKTVCRSKSYLSTYPTGA